MLNEKEQFNCALFWISAAFCSPTDGVIASRKLAAKAFELNSEEMENRHNQAFDTYEVGKLTLEEYLSRVVFYQKRSFTRAQFRKFMFAQSKPYPKMIELVRQLKARYGLKIVVVSNEARELNSHRIRKFKLDGFVDFFISSCFVHLRKPDADIFRLALDIAQVPANQVVYIENTPDVRPDCGRFGDSRHSVTRITSPRVRNWLRSDWSSE